MTLGELLDLFRAQAGTLAELESALRRIVVMELDALYKRLLAIPGVAPAVAVHLIYDVTRWQLVNAGVGNSCTGLDPRPNESGGRVGRSAVQTGRADDVPDLYMSAMDLKRCRQRRTPCDELLERGHPSTGIFSIFSSRLVRIAWGFSRVVAISIRLY